ncbi:MAG: divalent cation tolerance protein CutA [Candidatus Veblenbacteria bacterium]|nr:divalent cation tolerance protein CutA [Candidatus Veblenbacteria bacterium]
MARVLWVLVNCNSVTEASRIGRLCLKARLSSCFDVFKRERSMYYWPPKSGRTEQAKGALLVLETMPTHVAKLRRLVKANHSDTLPFIGSIKLEVEASFTRWVKGELK